MEAKTTTTYSMWSLFRNCRKACEWRYIQELVPLERDHNLAFGTVIHKCLEIWHGGRDLGPVLDFIDRTYPNRAQEEEQKRDWHLAAAMMCVSSMYWKNDEYPNCARILAHHHKIVTDAQVKIAELTAIECGDDVEVERS